jgi:hypothetical protein
MIVSGDIHQFCGTHTTFQFPSLTSHYPSLPITWIGFIEVGYPFSILCYVSWVHLYHASIVADFHTQTPSYFST